MVAMMKVEPYYGRHSCSDSSTSKDMNPGMWQYISILKIERVENGMQEDGSAEPYYKAGVRWISSVVQISSAWNGYSVLQYLPQPRGVCAQQSQQNFFTDLAATGLAERHRESGGPLGCTLTFQNHFIIISYIFFLLLPPSSHENKSETFHGTLLRCPSCRVSIHAGSSMVPAQ